jgi:hypothetical protein
MPKEAIPWLQLLAHTLHADAAVPPYTHTNAFPIPPQNDCHAASILAAVFRNLALYIESSSSKGSKTNMDLLHNMIAGSAIYSWSFLAAMKSFPSIGWRTPNSISAP